MKLRRVKNAGLSIAGIGTGSTSLASTPVPASESPPVSLVIDPVLLQQSNTHEVPGPRLVAPARIHLKSDEEKAQLIVVQSGMEFLVSQPFHKSDAL